ncbi:MAG: 5-formyltetrahydrofolate cyclo-ligase [SAR324 cluster bacterium]|nr:5-formyltetrahydrofolate cyclo-ligase [SAR324 cluster bacterium]
MLQLRAGMSQGAREEASRNMMEQLERLSVFRQAGGVHCFIGLPGEVGTDPIFKLCQALGKRTYVPIQMPEEHRLDVAAWRPGDPLAPGPFSVLEPPPGDGFSGEGTPVDRSGIDLVLVPGLAFDRQGGRLGYGKGYYDGFLAAMAAEGCHPFVIGLAFSCQIVERVPGGGRDFPMDGVLTEEGFFEAGK